MNTRQKKATPSGHSPVRLFREYPGNKKDPRMLIQEYARLKEENLNIRHLYENILNGITFGVWASDRDDVIFYVNKGMEMIAGVTHQKLLGYRVLTDSYEGTIDHFRNYYREAKETRQPVHYSEIPVTTPAGRQTFQSGWLIPRVRENKYDGMICILEDITNQKAMKNALHESETKYRELVENVNSVIIRMDLNGTITFLNEYALSSFGFSRDEILQKNVAGTILSKTRANVNTIKRLLKNIGKDPEKYAHWELKNIRKDGSEVWISWTNRPVFDSSGKVSEILCVGNDITELKDNERLLNKCRTSLEEKIRLRTAELARTNETLEQEVSEYRWVKEQLTRSEEKYRLVVENASEAIVVVQDGLCKYTNPKAEKILGYSKGELMLSPLIELIVHPDDKDLVRSMYFKRMKGDNVPNVYAFRIVDKDGNIKWLETNSVLISWMGRPAALAFFSNITERKKTEERLELLKSAFQQAKDSIVITKTNPASPSTEVVFVNPAFTNMMGYEEDELIANPSILLWGPRTDGAEWVKLEKSQSRDKAFSIETSGTKKDGSRIDLEWQITPLRDDRGKITHFVSIHRDITQRKKAEKREAIYQQQLRSLTSALSLAEEKERRRIATMLHDHIGQSLAISKIKLGTLRESLPPGIHDEAINDIHVLLEKSIQYTKSLTFELSPPILYELGFESAIEWFGEQIQKHHGILVEFRDDGRQKTLDRDVSVLLFQTVRELFMNIVKHAHARNVRVTITGQDKTITVVLEDDGVGFDTSLIDKTASFGFFSTYERIHYIGGSFEIDSTPGQGTRIILKAPVVRGGDGK